MDRDVRIEIREVKLEGKCEAESPAPKPIGNDGRRPNLNSEDLPRRHDQCMQCETAIEFEPVGINSVFLAEASGRGRRNVDRIGFGMGHL